MSLFFCISGDISSGFSCSQNLYHCSWILGFPDSGWTATVAGISLACGEVKTLLSPHHYVKRFQCGEGYEIVGAQCRRLPSSFSPACSAPCGCLCSNCLFLEGQLSYQTIQLIESPQLKRKFLFKDMLVTSYPCDRNPWQNNLREGLTLLTFQRCRSIW